MSAPDYTLIGEGSTPYIAYEEPVVPPPRRPPPPSCWRACWRALCGCCGQRAPEWRTIFLNASPPTHGWYPHNRVENTKYGLLSFVPKVLLEQFRYFFNLYFLLVALSQFVPVFEIGLRFTYIAPLVFVLAVTMAKEGYDDVQRWRTDTLINNEAYERLQPGGGSMAVPAKDLRVGDVVRVSTNQRIPADLVLLRTSSESGVVFVRTDQLDGETDWKLRVAVASTQRLASEAALSAAVVTLHAAPPTKDIYEFVGDLTLYDDALEGGCVQEPLALENTLWANTVLASCACHGVVVHTGRETRSSMNVAGAPPSKMATLDLQVNFMTKLLFVLVNLSALLMVAVPFGQASAAAWRDGQSSEGWWDGGWENSARKLSDRLSESLSRLVQALLDYVCFMLLFSQIIPISLRVALDMAKLVYKLQMTSDERLPGLQVLSSTLPEELGGIEYLLTDKTGTLTRNEMTFRKLHLGAACLDEAMVPELRANLAQVLRRTSSLVTLQEPSGQLRVYEVLHEMPFTSESKRMGILLRHVPSGDLLFYVKGADAVMSERVVGADWLEEETGNLAREGLRTLVVACRPLSEAQYAAFAADLAKARLAKTARHAAVRAAFAVLEEDMTCVCVTGVEDRLQAHVRTTLEKLRNANVRTWMLTGDKLETALIVAQNASLVARHQHVYTVSARSAAEARQLLHGYPQGSINAPCLMLDGPSLDVCVEFHTELFIEVACAAPTVVIYRCSPTQKAATVRLLRTHTSKIIAAIGDGGNDVGMIRAAHVGIGVEGREGKQAALAADFSITQFSHVARLVLWHGRNCYLRSATLSQFVIHRGLIISFIQLVFSALFYFRPIPLYSGVLVLGYATIFTTGPVFSLVLDEDVSETNAMKFPELYHELQKRRYLSLKTFLLWAWKALYQGGVIMLGGVVLFEQRFVHVVGITFTALILTENLMVVVEVKRWHPLMLLAQVLTLIVYVGAIIALSSPTLVEGDLDINFIMSVGFAWRVALITMAATVPIWAVKGCAHLCSPRVATKLS